MEKENLNNINDKKSLNLMSIKGAKHLFLVFSNAQSFG